jgi:hypothetical protein
MNHLIWDNNIGPIGDMAKNRAVESERRYIKFKIKEIIKESKNDSESINNILNFLNGLY